MCVFVLLPHDNYQYQTHQCGQKTRKQGWNSLVSMDKYLNICQQVGNPTAASAHVLALHGLVM